MASVFKPTYKRPVPDGADLVTRKGQRFARWKDKKGRTKSAPLSEDGKDIVLEYRCYYVAYEGADGRRITVKGFPDREATEQLARDKEKLAARIKVGLVNVDLDRATMPVGEALEAWVADLRRRGKSRGYVYNMELLVRRMADACRWVTIGGIRSDSLMTWLANLKEGWAALPWQKRRAPAKGVLGLSARTLNQYLETARAFVNWCCAQSPPWLPGNPLAKVAKADETTKRREKRALTLDELARLKAVSGRRWVVYLTAALTGLRRSELARLRWGDVHLDAEHPCIHLRAEATKAKRADVIPINPELLEALLAHRPADATDDQPVFPTVPKYATYRKDVEKRAKIAWRDERGRLASFHALRKTFATYLALADVPLRVAMDMMRVTEARLLHGVYTDAKLFNTSAAAARLPKLNVVRPPEEDQQPGQAAAG
jgi:integrase